jgi:hypothetical protein
MARRPTLPFALAGSFGFHRTTRHPTFWPRDLRRGALLLGLSAAVFWSSFALGRVVISSPGSGPIYVDLLLGWVAVILHIAAWPNLWLGLQDLRRRCPRDDHPVIAWRSFLITLSMILAAVIILPLEYHSLASSEPWVLVTYVTAFPYLGWTFVPILALHGVLFGRVAYYLDPRSRHLADAGAILLFAVAAATTAVILQNPGDTAFVRSWSAGEGMLPGAALSGYVLIALGITARATETLRRVPSWTSRRVRWRPSGERP